MSMFESNRPAVPNEDARCVAQLMRILVSQKQMSFSEFEYGITDSRPDNRGGPRPEVVNQIKAKVLQLDENALAKFKAELPDIPHAESILAIDLDVCRPSPY